MELSHTLETKPTLFIRAYLKFYDADETAINTCKLFWGGIGMIFLPILALICSPVIGIIAGGAWVKDEVEHRSLVARMAKRNRIYSMTPEERELYLHPPKSKRELWLEKAAATMGVIWFKVARPVTWFVRILAGALLLAGLAWLIVTAIDVLPGLPWDSILATAAWVISAVVIACIFFGLVLFLYGAWRESHPAKLKPPKTKKPSLFKAVVSSVHDHTCANVKIVRE